jgi:hypothetical protein
MVVHACNPALGRPAQEDHEFKASLGYRVRPVLREKGKRKHGCDWYLDSVLVTILCL